MRWRFFWLTRACISFSVVVALLCSKNVCGRLRARCGRDMRFEYPHE
jgi:hypothetical protein